MPRELLVTGFGPFGPHSVNPSEQVIGRTRIEFERFALNWRAGPAPDEDGEVEEGTPIDPAGPAACLSTAPVDALVAAAVAAGAPAASSAHAGTFLCNQVLYQTLRWCERRGEPCQVGFGHLPALRGEGVAQGMELDVMTAGVVAALGVLAESGG